MRNLGRTFRDIRQGERGLACLLAFTYALALFGFYLLKPARDALFLSRQSAADLPLAFMLSAVLAVPVSLAYGRASRKLGLGPLVSASFVLVILCLGAWRLALVEPGTASTYLFYAWVGIAGGLVASQFWLVGNAVCDAPRAKRLFPMLSLGGIAGAVLGGWAAGLLAAIPGFDPLDLLLICAAVWTVALLLSTVALQRRPAVPVSRRPVRDTDRADRLLVREITGSRHLMLIIGLVSVSVVVSTFIDFQFKTAAAAAFPEGEDLLVYLGRFYAVMNILSLGLQLVLTTRLLHGLGVGGSLLVLPAALTLGAGALLAAPGLMAAASLRAGEMGLKYSLDKTSRELLYLPLPLGLKRRVKVFIDTFVERGSRGLAGLLLLVSTAVLHLGTRGTTVVTMGLVGLWVVLALDMRRQYIQNFRRAVARRDIDRDDLRLQLRDPAAVATLAASLDSENDREVVYALDMLRSVPGSQLPEGVAGLLDHAAAPVREKALGLIVEAGIDDLADQVTPLLGDADPQTGRLAAGYLHRYAGEEPLREAIAGDTDALANVLSYAARVPSNQDVPDLATTEDLERLLAASATDAIRRRAAIAESMGRMWTGTVGELREALAAEDADVVGAGLAGLGRRVERRHLADLAALLADRQLRPWARRALQAYGPVAVPVLVTRAVTPECEEATRRAAMRALSQAPYQRTVDAVLPHLETAGSEIRRGLLGVLLRLRERRAELRFRRGSVERMIRRETSGARRLLGLASQLGPALDQPADRLLRRCLSESYLERVERIFRLLALRYDVRDIMGAWSRFVGKDPARRAEAQEFLENLISPATKVLLRGLRDVEPAYRRADRPAALRELMRADEPWLRTCAAFAAAPAEAPAVRRDLERLLADEATSVRDTASLVLDPERRKGTMLTTIEKAILLERVDHFDAVRGEDLAAIASIAEEVRCETDDVVYRAGDLSDAMYLVVDGEIALLRGDEVIAGAESGQPFGAWALFEAEPRMVDAVARRETRLLRIDREDFADLMADNINVAQSLLRSVARRLRSLASRAA